MFKLDKVDLRLPFTTFTRDEFLEPFNGVFNDFFNDFFKDHSLVQSMNLKRMYPKVDIFQEDLDLVFRAAVPGLTKDQLSITLEDNILSISGTTTKTENNEKTQHLCFIKELKQSSFIRRFTLSKELSINSLEDAMASLNNGILEIRFNNACKNKDDFKPKPKEIPIK